jgi:outer membrane protein OmpA-like peptidoglycan-associated protein
MKKAGLILKVFFCLCRVPVFGQTTPAWYTGLFIEAGAHYYFTPELFTGLVKPDAGFRAGMGLEWRHFRCALESGWTHIAGTNPLVLDIGFVPVTLKAGYDLPLYQGLGLRADLGLGVLCSNTVHYETAINALMDKPSYSPSRGFLMTARAYAVFELSLSALAFYAGGGMDTLFERDSPIALPLIEAGLTVKPFRFAREKRGTGNPPTAEAAGAAPPVEEDAAPAEDIWRVSARLPNAVYFGANDMEIPEQYRPVLDEAGGLLQADPKAEITLRAYAAPVGTAEGSTAISAARAWRCLEYLMNHYGIAEKRIHIEYYGADKAPDVMKNADWESWRCVELILHTRGDSRRVSVRLPNAVYFETNSMEIPEPYRPVLDKAGGLLRSDPQAEITLRTYSAPGTAEGAATILAARAWRCLEYLMNHYGVAEKRVHIEYYSADKAPDVMKNADRDSWRCVELIMHIKGGETHE